MRTPATIIKTTSGRVFQFGAVASGQVLVLSGKKFIGQAAGTPGAHAASHQNGGLDQISVAGLTGVLATPQTAAAHSHLESDVTGLVTDLNALTAAILLRQLSSEKGAANGYAPLDANAQVAIARIPGLYADDPGSITLATAQIRVHPKLVLSGAERITLAGTAQMILTDMGRKPTPLILGIPKCIGSSFTIPNNYIHDMIGTLTLSSGMTGTLAGNATLVLTDDFKSRSRITLTGRG